MPLADPRVLVVEDDHSWQQILAEILTDAGLVVEVAGNLEEALRLLRSAAHVLAIVDLSLGSDHHNQDGLQVLESLRRFDPQCKAILLTGYATVELAVSAITEHSAFTCLRKETFNRAEFRQLVQRVLASGFVRETGFSPDAAGQDAIRGLPKSTEGQGAQGGEKASPGIVLVVDDDASWRSILAELLVDVGARVRLCSGFGEALGCLRRERYVLAVVDLSLSGPIDPQRVGWEDSSGGQSLEGFRLLASARAGGVPTIVVSGVLSPEEIEQAYIDTGIFAFIQKQAFNRRAFIQTVQEALEARENNRELDILTGREREVLDLLARGLTNKEIAETLVISTNTVKRHLKAIFDKLEVHTRSAAAARAIGR
jgi:DNA-binding NarL/FixJ family response regulator